MASKGASFLATKSWHTGNKSNVDKVRRREQEDAAERKKVLELQKQLAEEREQERFEEIQEKSGLKVRDVKAKQKLAWMYRGPQQTDEERAKEREAVLLGEKEASLQGHDGAADGRGTGSRDKKDAVAAAAASAEKSIKDKNVIGSLWMHGQTSVDNEQFHIRHEDPLMAMIANEKTAPGPSLSQRSDAFEVGDEDRRKRRRRERSRRTDDAASDGSHDAADRKRRKKSKRSKSSSEKKSGKRDKKSTGKSKSKRGHKHASRRHRHRKADSEDDDSSSSSSSSDDDEGRHRSRRRSHSRSRRHRRRERSEPHSRDEDSQRRKRSRSPRRRSDRWDRRSHGEDRPHRAGDDRPSQSAPAPKALSPAKKPAIPPGYGLQLTGPARYAPMPEGSGNSSLGPSAEMIASRADYVERTKAKQGSRGPGIESAGPHRGSSRHEPRDRAERLREMERAGRRNEELRKVELESMRKTREAEAAEDQIPIARLDAAHTAKLVQSDLHTGGAHTRR